MKAVLFDLDGTLLPMDNENFIKKYIDNLAECFTTHFEPEDFKRHLHSATKQMFYNDGTIPNESIFWKNFNPEKLYDRDVDLEEEFEIFYKEEYPKLKSLANYSEYAPKIVEEVKDRGFKIVLATNPVFPKIAVEERMRWAGIKDFSWDLITTYENSRSCKPNLKYFKHICQEIKVDPEDCLMVGNDVQEDMIASTLGMKTYLVTEHRIDRKMPSYEPNKEGTLQELYELIKNYQ